MTTARPSIKLLVRMQRSLTMRAPARPGTQPRRGWALELLVRVPGGERTKSSAHMMRSHARSPAHRRWATSLLMLTLPARESHHERRGRLPRRRPLPSARMSARLTLLRGLPLLVRKNGRSGSTKALLQVARIQQRLSAEPGQVGSTRHRARLLAVTRTALRKNENLGSTRVLPQAARAQRGTSAGAGQTGSTSHPTCFLAVTTAALALRPHEGKASPAPEACPRGITYNRKVSAPQGRFAHAINVRRAQL